MARIRLNVFYTIKVVDFPKDCKKKQKQKCVSGIFIWQIFFLLCDVFKYKRKFGLNKSEHEVNENLPQNPIHATWQVKCLRKLQDLYFPYFFSVFMVVLAMLSPNTFEMPTEHHLSLRMWQGLCWSYNSQPWCREIVLFDEFFQVCQTTHLCTAFAETRPLVARVMQSLLCWMWNLMPEIWGQGQGFASLFRDFKQSNATQVWLDVLSQLCSCLTGFLLVETMCG